MNDSKRNETEVHHIVEPIDQLRTQIESGRLTRRDVLRRSIALGLSAPAIAGLLAACGGDDDDSGDNDSTPEESGGSGEETATEAESTETEAESSASSTEAEGSGTEAEGEETEAESGGTEEASSGGGQRGGGGELQLLWWQAPTILNDHYAQGTKDNDASRPIQEPLLSTADDGSLIPVLVEEVPSFDNGLRSEDGTTVTWKIRQGVKWHDGEDMTAEDVKFTYDWVKSEGNATTTLGLYEPVTKVELVDDHTVTITFDSAYPAWMESGFGRIIPKHIMQDYMGAKGPDAPYNLMPIGTGPYKVADFKPGDVVQYEIHSEYWDPGKPYFDSVTMKGGGDAASAARSVIQTGEIDYAWNLQVEATVLKQLASGEGPGELLTPQGLGVERIQANFADPNKEVNGAFAEPSTKHPFNTDDSVRQAYALLCDRDSIAESLYGPAGEATALFLPAPEAFVSPNVSYEFNPEKAAQILDEAGWTVEDGVRTKDGVKIDILYQTSTNTLRQKEQEIVKQALESVGMSVQLKAVDSSVFFSADPGNPETFLHFYADLQMFTWTYGIPYPLDYMRNALSADPAKDVAQKSNSWTGPNVMRWQNDEYNQAFEQALTELDPEKQAELFIKMNDLIVMNHAAIPLVLRADVAGKARNLTIGEHSRWASDLYNIADWTREEA